MARHKRVDLTRIALQCWCAIRNVAFALFAHLGAAVLAVELKRIEIIAIGEMLGSDDVAWVRWWLFACSLTLELDPQPDDHLHIVMSSCGLE